MSDSPAHTHSFSFGRVLLLAVPLAVIVWGAYKMYGGSVQQQADAQLRSKTFSGLFGGSPEATKLDPAFKDADGDMVADPPADDAALDPAEIKLSYFASNSAEGDEEAWTELMAALKEKLGNEVTFVSYADTAEQMRALKSGDLHIAAFGTGEVQGAVNEAGFVPVACFADEAGKYGYTMKIIVPADSPIQKPEDIKGRRMTFVRPRSNSGCTAALVMLMDKHGLQPERDYSWGFSYDHEQSIRGIADKRYQAAAVASDILERMIAAGEIQQDAIREIYESEPFPPGVVGVAYNLKPELRDGIRETLLAFDWKGTGLEKQYGGSGSTKFAPVSYKDDWKSVRDLRESGGQMIDQLAGP